MKGWVGKDAMMVLAGRSLALDRALGCIYGQALGDAYGLSTEFETADRIPFPNYKRTAHNSRWSAGDWTDDTDQMILVMETLTEHGRCHEPTFAAKLRTWIRRGFPELGDSAGMGLGATTAMVCRHPLFLSNPFAASSAVYRSTGNQAAPNGAVMRTAAIGCFRPNDREGVISNAMRFARVTHWDDRCVVSSVIVSLLVSALISQTHPYVVVDTKHAPSSASIQPSASPRLEEGSPVKPENPSGTVCAPVQQNESSKSGCDDGQWIEALISWASGPAVRSNSPFCTKEEHRQDIVRYLQPVADIKHLKLSDPPGIGYTLKCLAAGLYGLRSRRSFEETLEDLVREGGDADTNGAVCGALLGAKIGYSQLPAHWLRALPNKAWLDRKVVRFLQAGDLLLPIEQPANSPAPKQHLVKQE